MFICNIGKVFLLKQTLRLLQRLEIYFSGLSAIIRCCSDTNDFWLFLQNLTSLSFIKIKTYTLVEMFLLQDKRGRDILDCRTLVLDALFKDKVCVTWPFYYCYCEKNLPKRPKLIHPTSKYCLCSLCANKRAIISLHRLTRSMSSLQSKLHKQYS